MTGAWFILMWLSLVLSHSTTQSFYKWEELKNVLRSEKEGSVTNASHSRTSSSQGRRPLASQLIGGTPVYVSMTTIHNRLYGVAATLETLLRGSVLPTHIYIFVSSEPYLLDQGISKDFLISSSSKLRALSEVYPHISIIFTDNIGPHRKLLPLLAKKWDEDCVIVTIDDHEIYPRGFLASLIDYYRASGGTAVVALRSRRMGICANAPPWRVSPYTKKHKGLWPETKPGRREMLTLPTGTGGVLYRPQFFHPIVFDGRFLNLTRTGDDLMFRLATMAKGVPVVTACTEYESTQNVCPSRGVETVGASNHDIPAIPQLRSFRRAAFDSSLLPLVQAAQHNVSTSSTRSNAGGSGGRGGAGSSSSSHSSTTNTGTTTAGVTATTSSGSSSSIGSKSGSSKSSGTASISSDKKGNSAQQKQQQVDDGSKKKTKKTSTDLESESEPLLDEEIRTLQQSQARAVQLAHEYRLAALNELGSLRQRRMLRSSEPVGADIPDSAGGINAGAHGQRDSHHNSKREGPEVDPLSLEGRQNDMRKKESLASKFNSLGGNNVMWTHSIAFLDHLGVLDFESVLQYYAPQERMQCVLFSSVFSKGAGSKSRNVISSVLDNVRISLQNVYSHECGIQLCVEGE